MSFLSANSLGNSKRFSAAPYFFRKTNYKKHKNPFRGLVFNYNKQALNKFENDLANEISDYYKKCLKVSDIAKTGNGLYPTNSDKINDVFQQSQQLASKIDGSLTKLIKRSIEIG